MTHNFLVPGEPGHHSLGELRSIHSCLHQPVICDFSVTRKLVFSLLVLSAALIARDGKDAVLIIVVTATALFAKIMNSAIEALCNFVESRHNEEIRIIKGIATSGIGIAMFAWRLSPGFEKEARPRALF